VGIGSGWSSERGVLDGWIHGKAEVKPGLLMLEFTRIKVAAIEQERICLSSDQIDSWLLSLFSVLLISKYLIMKGARDSLEDGTC
jgi:hypothetical protein